MAIARTGVRTIAILTLLFAAAVCPPRASAAERAKPISFENLRFSLKSGEHFERSMLGKNIETLLGKPIIVRGWIWGGGAYTAKLKSFVLLRHNGECCFGPGSQLCDSIQVDMTEVLTVNYTTASVALEGILTVREFKDHDGIVRSVYHLQASKVK